MIKNFKDKNTKKVFEGESVIKWASIRRQLERRLQILDSATSLDDLKNLPSNRFEFLLGDRKGQCSIRVNKQWRICFNWIDDEAHNVEMIDYH